MRNLRRKAILDGGELFKVYFTDMGSARSLNKLVNYLGNRAINPVTGTKVRNMAVWFSMWKWAYENYEEAYKIFNTAMSDQGEYWTPEEWDELVTHNANISAKHSKTRVQLWQKRQKSVQTTSA